VLLATDANWIVDEVTAALGGPDTSFTVCREGRLVSKLVAERTPELAVLDLQVGSMGGMAIAMALRLDESGGLLPHVKVLMLLDRVADVYLAQRSGAEGWLIKPLDALRLKRAALAVTNGEYFQEGVPHPVATPASVPIEPDVTGTPEQEPAPAG
jgi:two-component system nitrate/nitrite response regulator NarL